jgi:hypothetical protein
MTTTPKEAYPLSWPDGLAAHAPAGSAADGVVAKDGESVPRGAHQGADAHGVALAVISSNVPLNLAAR